jgi:dTDP-4-amino-4,6-dideoxygalactose transaminase
MQVPAQAYDFSPQDIDEITGALRTLLTQGAFLTLGRYGEQFEREFAAYHDAPWGVATNSGTGALEIILRALAVEGKEVILPTNTFAATAFAVIRAGARPVFADIGPDLTLDPHDAAARITPDTGAVITVHIGGLISPATPELAAICHHHGLPLVEDAAHAHGSRLDGKAAGAFGTAAAFSFFSTKVMTTGEGGMILTADAGLDRAARVLRDQAKVGGGNRHETCGYNWRMPEVQAIMGLVQLHRLDEFIARRQAIAAQYDRLLAGIPGLDLLATPPAARHNYYKYITFLRGIAPDALKARLKRDYGVALGGYVYELPLHEQPSFRAYRQHQLPVAEDLCRRHVCPPIYPGLTDEQVAWVAQAMRAALVDGGNTATVSVS